MKATHSKVQTISSDKQTTHVVQLMLIIDKNNKPTIAERIFNHLYSWYV